MAIHGPGEYRRLYPKNSDWMELAGGASLVAWPLSTGGESIGVLVLMWTKPQPLNTAQLAYTSAVATMVAQALVRARVYADEHARAAVLQAAVLPSSPADIPGLDVGVSYEPADDVQGLGGDWYDVMALREGLHLPRGRGCRRARPAGRGGHGAVAQRGARRWRCRGCRPRSVFAELNTFARHASHGKFATMSVAVFDPVAGSLSYAIGRASAAASAPGRPGEMTGSPAAMVPSWVRSTT